MKKQQKIWDLPTRIFHWALISAVFYSWLSAEILEDMQQHFYSGYTILTLLLFRLIWGFIGSYYSTFRSFVFSIEQIISYARNLTKVTTKPYPGHNPLGGLSVMAMLSALVIQASSGLFSNDDYFFGALSGLVNEELRASFTNLHLNNINVVYALLALHVAAIVYYKLRKKEPLTKAMVTGRKEVFMEQAQYRAASNFLALIVLILCGVGVYCLVNAFTDLLPAPNYDY